MTLDCTFESVKKSGDITSRSKMATSFQQTLDGRVLEAPKTRKSYTREFKLLVCVDRECFRLLFEPSEFLPTVESKLL